MAKQHATTSYSPAVDRYIEQAADFAKPVLLSLREIVHATCPEACETMKWNMPFFLYRERPLCHIAAFKQHCAFGIWNAALLEDNGTVLTTGAKKAMGQFGRIQSMTDLPPKKQLREIIQQAMRLNEGPTPQKRKVRAVTDVPALPEILQKVFAKQKVAAARYEALRPSHKREYIAWIVDAKKEETRDRRVAKTIERLLRSTE